jgi:hypothetical protein
MSNKYSEFTYPHSKSDPRVSTLKLNQTSHINISYVMALCAPMLTAFIGAKNSSVPECDGMFYRCPKSIVFFHASLWEIQTDSMATQFPSQ